MNDDTSPKPPAPPPAGAAAPDGPSPAAAPRESLIDYPSRFPIKVVGRNEDGFVHAMTHIVRQFDPGFDAATIELRASGGGKYLGLTFTVLATSREQLDELYRTLSTHPLAKWVL